MLNDHSNPYIVSTTVLSYNYLKSLCTLHVEQHNFIFHPLYRCVKDKLLHLPSEADLLRSLQDSVKCQQCENLEVLLNFCENYNVLHAWGKALPDLVEFYQWIHTDLAYTFTEEEVASEKVIDVIHQFSIDATCTEDHGDHILTLFERVIGTF